MDERLSIPGQPRLTERVRQTAARDAFGQALILSGTGDLAASARFFAAAMECTGEDRPCGMCGPCRKVLRGVHPDVITVEDPEHKNIAVDVLRKHVADAYILPNEGKRKIYIFPDCSLLDPKAQNVLLKVVEEGPPHGVFLFCAENSAVLLPTIRSRAVEWKLSNAVEAAAGDDDMARRLCTLLQEGKAADIVAFCTELEVARTDREALQTVLSNTRDLLSAALRCCYTGEGDRLAAQTARICGRRRIARRIEVLETFIRQCNYNVNVGQLTGALGVALCD